MTNNVAPSISQDTLQNRGGVFDSGLEWRGAADSIAFDQAEIRSRLLDLRQPLYVVEVQGRIGVTSAGEAAAGRAGNAKTRLLATLPPMPLEQLGDADFRRHYRARYACYAGAMANGIASQQMVIALGKAGFLGSFGAAGLPSARLEEEILAIQQALPEGGYLFNLIHSPHEEAMERNAAALYLKHAVRAVEASAFMDLTPSIVHYRLAGLDVDKAGNLEIKNKVIAKISRAEVATKFLKPAPDKLISALLEENLISELQANLAQQVPIADDITVEADSGGHTDNRPLVCLIPAILALRNEIQHKYQYQTPVRVGAAGGISTPASALGALMMGAAYVTTGSVNQSCLEAACSEHTKKLLAQAGMADVTMAPSADMFELGVKVQVLKKGTLFSMRAQKLYSLYNTFASIDDIYPGERRKIEEQIFKRDLESVWQDTVRFFEQRDPEQIERARDNPKRKMALIFRWYLGLSSKWSNLGDPDRQLDYQIWCGPSMGAFNDWVRGTYLEELQNRRVVDVALHILTGAAYLYRVQSLKLLGLRLSPELEHYAPEQPLI